MRLGTEQISGAQAEANRAATENGTGVQGRCGDEGRYVPCHGSGFRASFVSIREGRVVRHITGARPQATWLFQEALVDRSEVGSQSSDPSR